MSKSQSDADQCQINKSFKVMKILLMLFPIEERLLSPISKVLEKRKEFLALIWHSNHKASNKIFLNWLPCPSLKVSLKVTMELFLLMGKQVQGKPILCKEVRQLINTRESFPEHLNISLNQLKELQMLIS